METCNYFLIRFAQTKVALFIFVNNRVIYYIYNMLHENTALLAENFRFPL